MAAMADRLPALLKGQERPKDVAEHLVLAQMCYDKKCYAAAARFWGGALEADPKLGDDLHAGHRYNAACAAALAGSGKAADDPPPDEDAQTGFRAEAREWLRADLALHAKHLNTGTVMARTSVVQVLQQWRQDSDLAGIRDADRLAELPTHEQKASRTLWADVDSPMKPAAKLQATETTQSGR